MAVAGQVELDAISESCGCTKDCIRWAQACIQCQKAKISRHNQASLGNFLIPTQRFQYMHMDIVGPLPISKGYRYCLTIIDQWLTQYGTPARVTTDQGRQFKTDLFRRLTQLTGTTHIRTTAYHPAANGMVERLHRQLKSAIKCYQTILWTEVLPTILLGIRAAWKEDLQATLAELEQQGQETEQQADTIVEKLRKTMQQLRPVIKRHGQKAVFIFKDMATTPQVFVRHDAPTGALQQPYDGPYEVLQRNEKTYKINGKPIISIDRLKPAYVLEGETTPTTPRTEQEQPILKGQTRYGQIQHRPLKGLYNNQGGPVAVNPPPNITELRAMYAIHP
ncbi:uncharacterized protein [Polyergus mexicanus]|uniref:uncharacterized protein n=1 Tax=Polyergus mexicanus TaxID=615972 RepID=UPI0038B578F7